MIRILNPVNQFSFDHRDFLSSIGPGVEILVVYLDYTIAAIQFRALPEVNVSKNFDNIAPLLSGDVFHQLLEFWGDLFEITFGLPAHSQGYRPADVWALLTLQSA